MDVASQQGAPRTPGELTMKEVGPRDDVLRGHLMREREEAAMAADHHACELERSRRIVDACDTALGRLNESTPVPSHS